MDLFMCSIRFYNLPFKMSFDFKENRFIYIENKVYSKKSALVKMWRVKLQRIAFLRYNKKAIVSVCGAF
jgi:hypothetical protein